MKNNSSLLLIISSIQDSCNLSKTDNRYPYNFRLEVKIEKTIKWPSLFANKPLIRQRQQQFPFLRLQQPSRIKIIRHITFYVIIHATNNTRKISCNNHS